MNNFTDKIAKNIFQFFTKKNIFLKEDWIRSFLQGNNIIEENELIYDTLHTLLKSTDISEYIDINMNTPFYEPSFVISDKYFIMQVESSFDTLQKIHKEKKNDDFIITNTDDKDDLFYSEGDKKEKKNNKRLTKLLLNYGINDKSKYIKAIEYEHIALLDKLYENKNEKLKFIIGPRVEIYSGIWALNNSNIKLL